MAAGFAPIQLDLREIKSPLVISLIIEIRVTNASIYVASSVIGMISPISINGIFDDSHLKIAQNISKADLLLGLRESLL